jgi:ABC-type multidrug transport system fused ATPase/permease subunit
MWFFQDYALGHWMNSMELNSSKVQINQNLSFYLLAAALVIILTSTNNIYMALFSLKSSLMLHSEMLDRIIFATVGWHDSQPTGRKVNRLKHYY